MHNQKNLTPLCLIGKWAYLVHWWYWYMYIFKVIRLTGTIQNFWILTVYRTVSIKRPRLIFFLKSLLNVRYDRKNEGLNILSTRSYNRVVRVLDISKKSMTVTLSYRNSQHSKCKQVCFKCYEYVPDHKKMVLKCRFLSGQNSPIVTTSKAKSL